MCKQQEALRALEVLLPRVTHYTLEALANHSVDQRRWALAIIRDYLNDMREWVVEAEAEEEAS